MTEAELLLDEIYHCLGQHIQPDLEKNEIFSAKYTVNWLINKIELYYKRVEVSE